MDIELERKREARWRILCVINAGRPIAVSEQIIGRVLTDINLGHTITGLRKELAYLKDLGLLHLEEDVATDTWYAQLSATGVDVVEYTAKAPDGITRPKKYW